MKKPLVALISILVIVWIIVGVLVIVVLIDNFRGGVEASHQTHEIERVSTTVAGGAGGPAVSYDCLRVVSLQGKLISHSDWTCIQR